MCIMKGCAPQSCPKCVALDSRGAATESSPGRKPGVLFRDDLSPVRGERLFRPYGAGVPKRHLPRACARGYTLSPLRGCNSDALRAIFGHPYFFVFSNDSMSPGLRSILSTAPI